MPCHVDGDTDPTCGRHVGKHITPAPTSVPVTIDEDKWCVIARHIHPLSVRDGIWCPA
jgi:hypothetical protein